MTFQLLDTQPQNAVIKVVGVGGGGGNAVNYMAQTGIDGVDFICANTDMQALKNTGVAHTLQLGTHITKGLGAGTNPEVGRESAMEDRERIVEALEGADMVFIAAGMGGGTGTGAAPIVAQVAKEQGALTVAVVTKPFGFEGDSRMQVAKEGAAELVKHVDSLITIPNDKLREELGGDFSLVNAFAAANDVLRNAVQGIAELITRPGLINVDFADVRTVMSTMGMAMMGSGTSAGEERARDAAEKAINSPLLEDVDINDAKGVLVNVTAGMNLTIAEFEEVGRIVKGIASNDARIVVGTVIDGDMGEDLRVSVVATGIGAAGSEEQPKLTVVDQPIPRRNDGEPDYKGLEQPTVQRAQPVRRAAGSDVLPTDADMDYFDVPAFLRRQND